MAQSHIEHPSGAPVVTDRAPSTGHPVFEVAVFVLFAALWVAFGAALVWSQGSLDQVWAWYGELPLIAQGIVGLLFLPLVVGLWVWESAWPLALRLLIVGGLAAVNLYLFFPRAVVARR